MNNDNQPIGLRMHYRKRFAQSIAETVAYRAGIFPDTVISLVNIRGACPDYRVELDEKLIPLLIENTICFDPCFEEPSILGAMKKNYEN